MVKECSKHKGFPNCSRGKSSAGEIRKLSNIEMQVFWFTRVDAGRNNTYSILPEIQKQIYLIQK